MGIFDKISELQKKRIKPHPFVLNQQEVSMMEINMGENPMYYYLRIAGVNLDAFINDTENLSTIRGSGLLLLRVMDTIQEQDLSAKLEPITTGASEGIFRFEAGNGKGAEKMRTEVAQFLIDDPSLKYATFVVDVYPEKVGFSTDKEALIARNRWRQFQQPTIVLPERNTDIAVHVCILDGIRPGTCREKIKAESDQPISGSVKSRRDYGKKQKQEFYIGEISRHLSGEKGVDELVHQLKEMKFARDLDALTHDPTKSNLHHKMAVIYLDGNSFGEVQKKAIDKSTKDENNSLKIQKDFDVQLKKKRAQALKKLLEGAVADLHFQSNGNLLLETLLWGGDELIWVVPAWKGWDVLSLFYNVSRDWNFLREPLTHAGGMVFCHHNAPIHRIVTLAKELAEAAKKEAKEITPIKNLFQYVILESFDHIGQDLDSFRKKQFSALSSDPAFNAGKQRLSLRGESMSDIAKRFRTFKEIFPRNKIFEAVHAAIHDADVLNKSSNKMKAFDARLNKIFLKEDIEKIRTDLESYFGEAPGVWLHLVELWDYVSGEGCIMNENGSHEEENNEQKN
jgi:hypothetical protein